VLAIHGASVLHKHLVAPAKRPGLVGQAQHTMLDIHLLSSQRSSLDPQPQPLERLLNLTLLDRPLREHLHHAGSQRFALAGDELITLL
jgi:hypothetical protein